ncbi:gephyrin-like molybdotransferase Glp [Actibacterium ureilyticum]|uniref:molybdopterin molybdotransferase MoeA n=1 Tax=Actibacterium ureilyticum TaxID=1590614 RepID=UPI000BAACB25|nr:gephyrin-like molybdotransferase Glp [Actibacterium ureilyticum]
MISVAEALEQVLALATPLGSETVPLTDAAGRVLAAPVSAARDQPPFDASAMDGYAVNGVEAEPHAQFQVIGTSAAGHGFDGTVGPGQAVRIFTGAPLPAGTDRVVIQEDVSRSGALITLSPQLDAGPHVRPAGNDFRAGFTMDPPRLLNAFDVTLLAAMNIAQVPVVRKPQVALIATGDELVMPGEDPARDQIIASNSFGLKALFEQAGAHVRLLPIAADRPAALKTAFDLAAGADLVVTTGGASVGDHDIVAEVAAELGMEPAFYKVAMRPGKPLMAGRLGDAAMVGLPGNPVSSMVCGIVFILPMLRKMRHLGTARAPRAQAPLAVDMPANGPREHYMRAQLRDDGLHPMTSQDSALLSVLAQADVLLIRPPQDWARRAGEIVEYLPLAGWLDTKQEHA